MERKTLIAFLFAALSSVVASGQEDSLSTPLKHESFGVLLDKHGHFSSEESHNLYLGINSNVFIRNAEYFLPYTKGYTAFGFYLDPTLSYHINGKAAVTAGVHLMGIAGNDGMRDVQPIFRIEYQPQEWISIVGGSLYGNLNHRLYEPMYDFDRYFYANDEKGLQILTDTKHWDADLWCNWETFIEPGDDFQERFTFGWTNRFYAIGDKNGHDAFELSVPLHIMATHRGGQFTSLQDTCIETLANAMAGITTSLNTPDKFIKKSTLDLDLFGFKNNSNKEHIHTHFQDGWGIYPNLTLQNNAWKVQAGYWQAHQYVGARGSYLFQSISYFDEAFERADRKMITAKLFYEHHFEGLGVGVEGQVYHDLDEESTDFSFGVYLRFEDKFKLLKIIGVR
ncbi:MAG: hypothetical protein MJZ33_12955 [Paludibacteraceae bacterium]|nr:hypothetical protein [Paludibacteraceae bacterium]